MLLRHASKFLGGIEAAKNFPIATEIVGDGTGIQSIHLESVGLAAPNGGLVIKFQVLLTHDEAWRDMANYGDKLYCFATPEGKLIGSFMVDTCPEDSHRPSRQYEFYNALNNTPITDTIVHMELDNLDDGSKVNEDGHEKIGLPALSNGCWQFHPHCDGYDLNQSFFVKYKDCWSSVETNRIFLNPSNSLAEGQMRVVLTWGEHPRDLDLHCNSSKKVYVKDQYLNIYVLIKLAISLSRNTCTSLRKFRVI